VLGTPTRDRKAERRAQTRREILEAAWELARAVGLNQLTLRDVAARVGMQAPSLYTHFDSKMAIYDAMFAQAWSEYEETVSDLNAALPRDDPREAAYLIGRHFYDYAAADLARHQLMNQRIIPGFEPTPDSYAPSVRVFEHGRERICALGDLDADDYELFVVLIGGLINQHHANDPGGNRYAHLLRRAVSMWSDSVGLPPSPPRRSSSRKASSR
jgi:AcrR family transcriptional regulator